MSSPVVISSNTFHPKKNNDYLIIGTSSPVTGALKLFRNALKPHNLDPTVQDLLKRFSDGNVRKMIEREFLGRTDSTEQAIRLLTLLKNIKYKFEGENLTPDQSIVEGWLINALLLVSDYSNDFYYGITESYLKNLAEFEKKLRDKTFREAFLDLFYNRDIRRLGEPVARRRELPKTGFYSINDYSEINYALSIPTDNIVITHNARDEENFLEHIVKVLESAGVSIEKIEIPKTLFNKRLSPRKLPPAAEVAYHIKSDPYFELRVRLRDRRLKSIRGYFGEKNSFSYIPAGSLISLNGIGLNANFIAQMPLGEMVMFAPLRSAEVLRLWGFAPVQGQGGIFVKIAQLSKEELDLLLNAQRGISPCFYPLFGANTDLIEIRNRVKEIVNKILASSSSPINQERLDNLLNNLREETITAVIDRKVKEIFEMLEEEDDLLILSKEQIILLVTKMKQCSENFSTNFFLDNLFLASRMDAKELLPLFLELTYSVSSRELRDDLLHAIDYAINVHEVIRLSQKQFDDLINFIKWYLPKNANTYSARGSIANMLGATLDQEEIKISQEQLNNVIEALGDLDITIDDISILTSAGPDYLAIAAGMGFVTKAIKKNKELVMNQQHFDILLKTLPKIIHFHNPIKDIRGQLKWILRKNRELKVTMDSFHSNDDVLNFCNQIIEIVEKGEKVKVEIVGEELKRKFGEEIEVEAYDLEDLKEMIGEEIHSLSGVNIYVGGKDIADLSPYQLLDPKTKVVIKVVSSPLALVTAGRNPKERGGIDLHALPIQTQQIKSLQSLSASPFSMNPNLDFDKEWTQIQAVFNAGIRPSVQRLVEFSAAAAGSPAESRRIEDVLGLIADLLRQEEEAQKLTPTDPALKGLLSAFEI